MADNSVPHVNESWSDAAVDSTAVLECERKVGFDPPRNNVLGVGISVLNLRSATDNVLAALERRRKGYICVTGVHGVIESQDCEEFRAIQNNSFLTTPDGMPMVWLGKKSGYADMGRVYGPDLMLAVCERGVAYGRTHYLYGGGDGVAPLLAERLSKRIPGLQIVGTYTPPFRPLDSTERDAFVEEIREIRPDCIWVGLSTPKQERFMAEMLPLLDTTLMFGVGAAFDFHAGLVRQAPRWIQQSGFEWAFRMGMEPRRLGKRYIMNNSRFIKQVFGQALDRQKNKVPSKDLGSDDVRTVDSQTGASNQVAIMSSA